MRCIEFFWSGKLNLSELPFLSEKTYWEVGLQLGWDVFQKRQDPTFRMVIAKDIEDEPVSRDKSVAVPRNPRSHGRAFRRLDKYIIARQKG